jgi:hypothetical protein
MRDPSFQRATLHYAHIRRAAYATARADALELMRTSEPLVLADTNPHVLALWRATWTGSHRSGAGGWDWEPLLRDAWRRPSAFHLALWSGARLCGLAVGRVSGRVPSPASAVCVDYVEGAPDRRHPLRGRVAFLTTVAADAYGRALGAGWIRLADPLPGAVRLYENLGFEVVRNRFGSLYCQRRIET